MNASTVSVLTSVETEMPTAAELAPAIDPATVMYVPSLSAATITLPPAVTVVADGGVLDATGPMAARTVVVGTHAAPAPAMPAELPPPMFAPIEITSSRPLARTTTCCPAVIAAPAPIVASVVFVSRPRSRPAPTPAEPNPSATPPAAPTTSVTSDATTCTSWLAPFACTVAPAAMYAFVVSVSFSSVSEPAMPAPPDDAPTPAATEIRFSHEVAVTATPLAICVSLLPEPSLTPVKTATVPAPVPVAVTLASPM